MRFPLAALVAGLAMASGVTPASAATAIPADAEKVSNERTDTRWAHAAARGYIRRAPDVGARALAPIKLDTELNFPNVYLVLRRWTDPDTQAEWLLVRIPQRPNGKVGWLQADRLGPLHVSRDRLVVNKRTLRATLYRNGRRIFRAPVGVGEPGTPTPRGRYWIRERVRLSGSGGLYGPLAFGTAAYSTLSDWPKGGVVGIHGTNQPGLIPGRPSHGCIRMRNRKILRLGKLLRVGTPLRIR
jgi:hypothetical protein